MRTYRPMIGWLAGAATVLAPLAAVPAAAQVVAQAPQVVQVATGQGRLVTLDAPMSDLFVASDAIADVQVRSPTQLYIFGKAAGETTVYATTTGGRVVYAATVRVGNNIGSIDQMLRVAMPDAQVSATTMNGLVLLTGTVANPDDAAEAQRLVQAYVGENTRVLTRLRTATPLQVNLQVRVAEVSRSFVKNIGVNITSRDSSGGFLFGIGQGRQGSITTVPGVVGLPNAAVDANGARPGGTLFGLPAAAAQGTTLFGAGNLLGVDLIGALDLGERIGQVTTLANPNMTALSGETGSFLAGGEIPIPISQGLGAVSVEYKQYGVSLAYTPTVLADGRISLRVRPEVSQLSAAGSVQLNGTTIPALTTRRVETTVELGSGQSMMIGGLLSNSHDNSITKAPGLGDLPIIGALFRSNGFTRNETELVIVITPYLVKPVNDQSQIALPTDGYKTPSDVERVLLGQLQGGGTPAPRPVPTMAPSADARPAIGALAPLPAGPTLAAPPAPAPGKDRGKRGRARPAAPGFTHS